jgi:hypothetical protein
MVAYRSIQATNISEKESFLDELKALQSAKQGECLASGDFNLIYKKEDKNNTRLNRRLMGKFKAVLDDLELKELPLHGRKFIWSSNTSSSSGVTMTRIDRCFLSLAYQARGACLSLAYQTCGACLSPYKAFKSLYTLLGYTWYSKPEGYLT